MHRPQHGKSPEVVLPGLGLNLHDHQVITDLFDRATQANLETDQRIGATVHLPEQGRLLVSGDLHDNGPNLLRLLKLARLDLAGDHHLLLHELIHGPHRVNGRDLSIGTLARAAALKLQYPGQVHLMQANHELAQYSGDEITKDGVGVVDAFNLGVQFIYGEHAGHVRSVMRRFIASFLLAVRCANGIQCSHSLPSPHQLSWFDPAVLDRVPTEADLASGGSAHAMVWGRRHDQDLADRLAEMWPVRLFIVGHQPAEMGYETEGDSILIMASNHDHGVALPIDLSRRYELVDMVRELVPLMSVIVR